MEHGRSLRESQVAVLVPHPAEEHIGVSEPIFNPRTHEGYDVHSPIAISHLDVSIHAPTRGATPLDGAVQVAPHVSIHAPTRGATPSALA